MSTLSKFRAGDLVEVRSEEEILSTLDERGMLDGAPFMPEMLRHCGKRFTVGKVAHKTCDTMYYSGVRRVSAAVHLADLRCDGSEHGGCDADCLLFWKDEWLKPAGAKDSARARRSRVGDRGCTRQKLFEHTRRTDGERYTCQVTELLNMSRPWAWWNPAQYVADIRSVNFPLRHVLRILALAALRRLIPRYPNHPILVNTYNRIAARGGMPGYFTREQLKGSIPHGSPTPGGGPQLQAGDLVKIRGADEIVGTLSDSRNKGLSFDTEMFPYCGGTYRVRGLVKRLIDETTGRMIEMKSPCVKLEGVICRSAYSEKRYMCPRAIMSYWRPLWLEKLSATDDVSHPPG